MSARRTFGICELGPIRPPSESMSLLIRATRNCPWNKCLFCPVYKDTRFAKRDETDVLREIDILAAAADTVRRRAGIAGDETVLPTEGVLEVARDKSASYEERRMALWMHRGAGRQVFLQDADSLIRPVRSTLPVLQHLYRRFPSIDRVCTYARSRTLAAKTPQDLRALREAGLTRIHVGLESGSDAVLALVNKGCTARHHIEGIGRAMDAGFEVCCYVMPGLGGRALSDTHADETARVLRIVDPHHVRLRTLFVNEGILLYEKVKRSEMELLEEHEIVLEIKRLLSGLRGARGQVVSDHDHNLLLNINGHLTDDADLLEASLDEFLNLQRSLQDAFIAARRSGRLLSLSYFLSDDEAGREGQALAASLLEAGKGSLLKGIIARFSPRLF